VRQYFGHSALARGTHQHAGLQHYTAQCWVCRGLTGITEGLQVQERLWGACSVRPGVPPASSSSRRAHVRTTPHFTNISPIWRCPSPVRCTPSAGTVHRSAAARLQAQCTWNAAVAGGPSARGGVDGRLHRARGVAGHGMLRGIGRLSPQGRAAVCADANRSHSAFMTNHRHAYVAEQHRLWKGTGSAGRLSTSARRGLGARGLLVAPAQLPASSDDLQRAPSQHRTLRRPRMVAIGGGTLLSRTSCPSDTWGTWGR
jgi:hypothetical protein